MGSVPPPLWGRPQKEPLPGLPPYKPQLPADDEPGGFGPPRQRHVLGRSAAPLRPTAGADAEGGGDAAVSASVGLPHRWGGLTAAGPQNPPIFPQNSHLKSYNHRVAWVEKDLRDHLVSTPLLWAESPITRPGCPEPNHSPHSLLKCIYFKSEWSYIK